MASNRGKKPKKEGMYVYNMVPNVLPATASVKNVVSKGWGYSLLMRSKTCKENSNREKVVGEIVSNEPRKSASSIVGERRSSVSDQGEANVRSAAAFLQVKVLVSDMPGFMQVHALRCARTAYDSLDKFSSKHMAFNFKKEFDKVYGPAWHCIVGSSFGSFVTHSTGCFLYFSMEKLYILVFKTKVQRALQDHI